MVRMTVAGIGGFFLVFIESYIVMFLKGYQTIEIGGISPFVTVWSMNFFFLFAMFTHFKMWFENREETREEVTTK